MKILLAGWNKNGEKCLKKLIENGFKVVQAILPKDKDIERIKKIAKKNKIPFLISSEEKDFVKCIREKKIDLMISASFPTIFSKKLLAVLPMGAINVHASQLPKYRGIHPLNWAIINDESDIGVTVHYLSEKVDSGDIIEQATIPLKNEDTINTVLGKITDRGAEILIEAVKKIEAKKVKLIHQNHAKASFAPKRKPSDGRIDWSKNSRKIFNLIRALESPYPNAFTFNEKLKKIQVKRVKLLKKSGQVVAKLKGGYLISTGDGILWVETDTNLKISTLLK